MFFHDRDRDHVNQPKKGGHVPFAVWGGDPFIWTIRVLNPATRTSPLSPLFCNCPGWEQTSSHSWLVKCVSFHTPRAASKSRRRRIRGTVGTGGARQPQTGESESLQHRLSRICPTRKIRYGAQSKARQRSITSITSITCFNIESPAITSNFTIEDCGSGSSAFLLSSFLYSIWGGATCWRSPSPTWRGMGPRDAATHLVIWRLAKYIWWCCISALICEPCVKKSDK